MSQHLWEETPCQGFGKAVLLQDRGVYALFLRFRLTLVKNSNG